jgi:fatty acid desaturase
MTSTQSRSFGATLDDLARDIVDAFRRAVRAIAVMPWPAMLACCVALAFVISVLPLALFLFVLFMGIKVIIGAFVVDHRRTYRDHDGEK